MSHLEGHRAASNTLTQSACRMRHAGLTLLEVAIAGAILMGGLAFLAQLVRTTLSSSAPSLSEGVPLGPVVEQQLRLNGAFIKGNRVGNYNQTGILTTFDTVNIYNYSNVRNTILPGKLGFGGRTYTLKEQEITAKLTKTSATNTTPTDPVVGFTRFWKLEVSPGGQGRAGL